MLFRNFPYHEGVYFFILIFMNITILGTGMVGRTLAESLLSHDHRVTMGTRDVASTEEKTGEGSFSLWHSAHASIPLLPFAEAVK